MMYAVVRVRGGINAPKKIKDTLKMLDLPYINNCVILPKNKSYEGMLKKVKDYITWGEIDEKALKSIFGDEVDSIKKGKFRMRLHPPIRGYEGIKRSYKMGGALEYRGKDIEELLKRMI